jgi:hypothetical protein
MNLQQFLQGCEIIKLQGRTPEFIIRFLRFLKNIFNEEDPPEG